MSTAEKEKKDEQTSTSSAATEQTVPPVARTIVGPRTTKASSDVDDKSVFRVILIGELVGCSCPSNWGSLLSRFEFVFGADWSVVGGIDHGITQTSSTSSSDKAEEETETCNVIWNLPLDVAFTSRNPFGWPQLTVAVFGPDSLGRDVVRGYSSCHVPICSGRFEHWLNLWTLQPASKLESVAGIITGKRTEYIDPKFAARGPGREVTKVQSIGKVKIAFEVVINGMKDFGFSETSSANIC